MPLPKGPTVVVGFHNWGFVTSKFMMSLLQCHNYEGRRILGTIEVGSPYVTEARNRIVHKFLATPARWLLMVDCDIEFPEDAVSNCLYLAESNNIPVLAGDYALGNNGHSLFAKDDKSTLCRPLGNLEPQTMYRNVYGAGTGWLFIRRDVLEAMQKEFPGPWHWFDHDPHPVNMEAIATMDPGYKVMLDVGPEGFNKDGVIRMGEDLSFCARVNKLGFEIAGVTGLRLVHHKQKGIVSDELAALFQGADNIIAVPNPYTKKEEKKDEVRQVQPPDDLGGTSGGSSGVRERVSGGAGSGRARKRRSR